MSDFASLRKEVFGSIYFGFVEIFVPYGIPEMISDGVELGLLAFCLIGIVAGFFVLKLLVYDLIDAAWDNGDTLVLKNNLKKDSVPQRPEVK